jgi:hypothetical protein
MLRRHLAMAENHVARGLKLIDKQRGLIARLTPDHRVCEQANEVLAKLQEMQEVHEQHRDRLKRELQEDQSPP